MRRTPEKAIKIEATTSRESGVLRRSSENPYVQKVAVAYIVVKSVVLSPEQSENVRKASHFKGRKHPWPTLSTERRYTNISKVFEFVYEDAIQWPAVALSSRLGRLTKIWVPSISRRPLALLGVPLSHLLRRLSAEWAGKQLVSVSTVSTGFVKDRSDYLAGLPVRQLPVEVAPAEIEESPLVGLPGAQGGGAERGWWRRNESGSYNDRKPGEDRFELSVSLTSSPSGAHNVKYGLL
jgi:hypothetical protein